LLERLGVDFLQIYEFSEQGWILHNEAARRGVSSPGAFPQELLRRALESNDAVRSEAGYVAVPVMVAAGGAVSPVAAGGPDAGAGGAAAVSTPSSGEPGDRLIVPGFWLGQDFFPNVREVTQGRLHYGQLEIYTRVVKQSVWVTAAILFAVTAGVSLAAAALLARQVSRPILALTDGMKRVAAGRLDEKVTVRVGGEIGYLVESFNRMTEDLKFHKDQLARAERIAAWQDVARYAAHEIRNPLTPIKVSIHRLRSHLDGLAEEERTRFSDSLESILHEVSSLERLATSFSEFAKLPEPVLAPTDLNKIIRELAELYGGGSVIGVAASDAGGGVVGVAGGDAGVAQPGTGAAGKERPGSARIVLSLSESLPPASVDAQQVRMAFANIVKNAMEAQPDGGVLEIKSALSRRSAGTRAWRDSAGGAVGGPGAVLSGEGGAGAGGTRKGAGSGAAAGEAGAAAGGRAEGPGALGSPVSVVLTSVPSDRAAEDFIEITFQDTGCGISESDIARVGTPHFTTKKRGTGLGLAMVNKIVSQHGGELSIESREARGTLVRILLPVRGTINR
jgi:nitrogen fixation/metabolism regulation signal transduction histidine kinase